MSVRLSFHALALCAALASPLPLAAMEAPGGTPGAVVDLDTREGVAVIGGPWRYSDVRVSEVDFRAVGADLKPSGAPNRTLDITPRAGGTDFDDSGWAVIDPTTLSARRGNGKLSFNWYRLAVTVPARVGNFDPTGSTAVLDIVVDDYAEVWVDGRLERTLGQRGGTVVAGWNASNRVVIARDVKPGQKVLLAVFGINGPISASPENYIWVRSARLEFHRPLGDGLAFASAAAEVQRLDPVLDALVPRDAKVEKLADGFQFGEGPVWSRDGSLLFSDPNTNVIYRWTLDGRVAVYREKSGYDGADVGRLNQPGSNGLTFDPEGRLLMTLGKKGVAGDNTSRDLFNQPNHVAIAPNGDIYVSDGYANPRVVKFSREGKYLLEWGKRGSGPPGRSSAETRSETSRRRSSAYALSRRRSSGTSTNSGSPYHASRSANASFADSTTVWTNSAVLAERRSKPSSSASCCRKTGPCPHGPVLKTVWPR